MSNLTKLQTELKQLQDQLKNLKKGLLDKKTSLNNLKKNNPSNKTEIEKLQTQIKEYPNIIKAKEAAIKAAIQKLKNAGNTSNNPVPTQGANTKTHNTKTNVTSVKRCTTTKCKPKASNKAKPNICITLDHLNQDKKRWGLTSLDIATRLRKKGIPVTVFVSCTGGTDGKNLLNSCTKDEIDMMKKLHGIGVSLGIHTLETYSKKKKIPTKANQTANIEHLRSKIKEVTKKYPRVASYHGAKAGPHDNINLTGKNIEYVRGVSPDDGGRYNTPVKPNKNSSLNNLTGVTTFFFHSNELILLPILSTDSKADKKRKIAINKRRKLNMIFFEKLIKGKYNFVDYYSSMKIRYK